jgi:polysaccharide pyruvyl transferase WcaK-like protein
MAVIERMGRIGLMGPYGYGNLGDDAFLGAMIQNIRQRHPETVLLGFALDPVDTERRHGITCHPLSRMTWQEEQTGGNPFKRLMHRLRTSDNALARRVERVVGRGVAEVGMLRRSYRALEGVDALIACGSGQIQDYWAGGGPMSYPYTMLRWAILARLRGAEFVVVSVGAGPVDARLSKVFFRWALRLASYRSYRDEWSRTFVEDVIGMPGGDPVYPDLAFSYHVPGEAGSDNGADGTNGPSENASRVVGIGPIGYYHDRAWPESDPERWAAYLDMMATVTEHVLDRGNRIVFLKGEALHDQPIVDELVAELQSRGVDLTDRSVDLPINTIDELFVALSTCDVVVAARFHNVLLSYVLGRPVLSASYQAKIEALMAEFGQSEFVLPIADATAPEMIDRFDRLVAQPDVSDRVASIVARKRRELGDQYDELFPRS